MMDITFRTTDMLDIYETLPLEEVQDQAAQVPAAPTTPIWKGAIALNTKSKFGVSRGATAVYKGRHFSID
jgi:hypothetical protein